MTDQDGERFADLARRTEEIRPPRGFTDVVMAAVEAAAVETAAGSMRLGDGVARSGIVAVALAAVAAAACVVVSIDAQSRLDEQVLLSVDTVEIGE